MVVVGVVELVVVLLLKEREKFCLRDSCHTPSLPFPFLLYDLFLDGIAAGPT